MTYKIHITYIRNDHLSVGSTYISTHLSACAPRVSRVDTWTPGGATFKKYVPERRNHWAAAPPEQSLRATSPGEGQKSGATG